MEDNDIILSTYYDMRNYRRSGMDTGFLIKQAIEAQKQAYAPYSGFRVGAAILCTDGSIYTGCNVEKCCVLRFELCPGADSSGAQGGV